MKAWMMILRSASRHSYGHNKLVERERGVGGWGASFSVFIFIYKILYMYIIRDVKIIVFQRKRGNKKRRKRLFNGHHAHAFLNLSFSRQ